MQPIKLRDFLDFAAVSSPTCAPSGDGYTWVKLVRLHFHIRSKIKSVYAF